jgi:hypothetical protein
MTLLVGTKLKGFCGGFFGRDSYDDKRVEAVGVDWVVVRTEDGTPLFARDDEILKVHERLQEFVGE